MGLREYFRQRAIKKSAKRHAVAKKKDAQFEKARQIHNKHESDLAEYKTYVNNYNRFKKNRQARKALGKKQSFKEFQSRKGFKI